MYSQTNTSLRKAVDDLSQVLNSSLGANQECMQAMTGLEEMLNSLESKLNGSSAMDVEEPINFAPETIGSKV